MKLLKIYRILPIALLAMWSCGQNQSSTEASDSEAPKGKYAIKSGIVEYKSSVMGMEQTQTLMFDDYGNIEATEIVMEMMGNKVHTYAINKDSIIYNIDIINKVGSKVEIAGDHGNIDFENMTEEEAKELNLKNEGKETFLDKECVKYSIDNAEMQMKGLFWVYKGVTLKSDIEVGGMQMVIEAISFEEDATIPENAFVVPEDVVFQ
ncbi:MAG: hypothetical protein ACOX0M_02310 [Salinivirgaceae bacterium]|jgi:hypothetical protein|nr:hypothetical protein [Bacteroidales bacterium]